MKLESMTLLDIMVEYPQMETVFHEYDSIDGKCLLCEELFESLDKVINKYSINREEILNKLLEKIEGF